MMHPAMKMDFWTLLKGLSAEVISGNVTVQSHPVYPYLRLYTYTKQCVFNRAWNDYNILARGLVLDEFHHEVAALPFPKFFNLFETTVDLDRPFEAFEKLDGSMIVIFNHMGEWLTATKGSFTSEQAKWAKAQLENNPHFMENALPSEICICEAIYPENKIVIPYPVEKQGLHLLGAYYKKTGGEHTYFELEAMADDFRLGIAKEYEFNSIQDMMEMAATLPSHEEGWVVRFQDGTRIKIKGDEYCKLHRVISRVTPLAVWEIFLETSDPNTFKSALPEEFWKDFDNIWSILEEKFSEIYCDAEEEMHNTASWTNKEIGLRQKEFKHPSLIFAMRNNNEYSIRKYICNLIRPKANKLDGYVPSTSMTLFLESSE